MTTDLTVVLQNRPGTLADLGEALGKAGVNIVGGAGFPCGGEGIQHVLVEDAAKARSALEAAGFEIKEERQALVMDIVDEPGEFGKITRGIANAGVNIDLMYVTASGKLVLGVDDMDKALAAI